MWTISCSLVFIDVLTCNSVASLDLYHRWPWTLYLHTPVIDDSTRVFIVSILLGCSQKALCSVFPPTGFPVVCDDS